MEYTVQELKNGLTIIVCNRPGTQSVYFDFSVKVGSRYENEDNNGIAHLVEHLKTSEAIDSITKHPWIKHYINDTLEAYSNEDRTNIEFKIQKKDIDAGFAFLKTFVTSTNFSSKKINLEKQIIVEELSEYKSDNFYQFDRMVKKTLYKKHPLSFEIAGSQHSLRSLNARAVAAFIKTYYQPRNCILTIAGDVSVSAVKRLADTYLKNLEKSSAVSMKPYVYFRDTLLIKKADSYQNHVGIHIPFFTTDAKENVRWEFFTEFLNNYLFYTLKNRLSLYSFDCNMRSYAEFIDFFIEASFDKRKTVEFYVELQKALRHFRSSITAKELETYKEKKQGALNIDQDDPVISANMVGWYRLMFGKDRIIAIAQQKKLINTITKTTIQSRFDSLFGNSKGVHVFYGNFSESQSDVVNTLWKRWKF